MIRLTDEEIAEIWADYHNQGEAVLLPDSPEARNVYRAASIKQWPNSGQECYFANMVRIAQLKKVMEYLGGAIMLQKDGDFILEAEDWQALLEEVK